MSVLECDRNRCTEIMCDKLILNGTRYICWDCWHELQKLKETWPKRMSAAEVEQRIRDFMASPKGSYTEVDTDEEFYRLTEEERRHDFDD